jgi:hypothetical protein
MEAKVLGVGEKSGGLHTNLYDLLTPSELRGLAGISARSKEGLLGTKAAILGHEKTRNRQRIILLCKALNAKLYPVIFDELYLIVTNKNGIFVPFEGPVPKTVLEFLKILNFETERGPYTTKRLLGGNSNWKEADLLWQYCELGLCPLPTKVFDNDRECEAYLDSIGEEEDDDFQIIYCNWGAATRNLSIEMRAKGLNPNNPKTRDEYERDNPTSKAVKERKLIRRCYLVRVKGTPFQYIPEPKEWEYETKEAYIRAYENYSFIPVSLEALAKYITEELIYVARNPAICDDALGLSRKPEVSLSQALREEEELESALRESREGGGGKDGAGAGGGGGAGAGGGGGRKRQREE